MFGIDISNYQKGINLDLIPFDFLAAKATEGIGFVDKNCDFFIQKCISLKKPFGFYHFARPLNEAKKEAEFFVNNCKGYFGKGIPVLDWEAEKQSDTKWALDWLNRVYELTGVKAVIYMSESTENSYDWSEVVKGDFGLWIAKHGKNEPTNGYEILTSKPVLKHWKFACMWQFTSNGHLNGYNGSLDLNEFYGDDETWKKYATSTKDTKAVNYGRYYTENFNGVKYHIFEQGENVKLGMISVANNSVLPLLKIDDDNRIHYAKMNGSRFVGATGQHLGVEVNRQYESVPRQDGYLAFWIDKQQNPHYSKSSDFWLTRNDIEFAISPDAILIFDNFKINLPQGNSNQPPRLSVVARQSILVRLKNKKYAFVTVETPCSLLECEKFLVEKLNCEMAVAFDGGGSSQLEVLGKIAMRSSDFNERKISNCLTFYRWKNADEEEKIDIEQTENESTLNVENEALKIEVETLKNKNNELKEKLEQIENIAKDRS